LGEFGLIDRITVDFEPRQAGTRLGMGDDAAVIDPGGMQVVWSTDMLCEGVHFDLAYVPLKHLGFKAVAVNLSDICAMNALPTHITVSLALSNRFSVEAVDLLYEGVRAACQAYGVDLVGGDTTSSQSGLVLSLGVMGLAKPDAVVSRSGAKAGDLLVVSGDLGAAYMGLQILEREKHVLQAAPGARPELDVHASLIGRQLKPEARLDVVRELQQLRVKPTAMIDVSDGLASEIKHLCKRSQVGVRLYEDKIPVLQETYSAARSFELDPTMCALSGGEDYELLFAVSPSDINQFLNHPLFSVIGHFTEPHRGQVLVTKQGLEVPLQAQGWDGFTSA
jgi:thiamine-monophosphate kinase